MVVRWRNVQAMRSSSRGMKGFQACLCSGVPRIPELPPWILDSLSSCSLPAITAAQQVAFSLGAPIGSSHLLYGFVCHPGHELIRECFDELQIDASKLEPHLEPAIPHFGTAGACSVSSIKLLQRALSSCAKGEPNRYPALPLYKEAYPEDVLWELLCRENHDMANSYANANAYAFARRGEPVTLTPQVQRMLTSSHPHVSHSALSAKVSSLCTELSPIRSKQLRPPGMDAFGVPSKGLDASAAMRSTFRAVHSTESGMSPEGAESMELTPSLGGSAPNPDLKRLIIPAGGMDASSDHTTSSADDAKPQRMLGQVGVNLDELARDGKLDPVIGREDVVRQVFEVLLKRRKPNVCLVGDAGCGKTALAEAVALEIAAGAPCHAACIRPSCLS